MYYGTGFSLAQGLAHSKHSITELYLQLGKLFLFNINHI